ncbi:N-alpha-acetyltransferase 25, NatB auxiliary subunit [Planococcus citri]|uniref:N-alpha-acetyltransferase 25, NatB auxiliary subunit n=1 Tax=Planococcus citri TaxID=170843 RepID=UPI0031F9E946
MSKTNADTVAERRLRPVYDWLDNGNNKKAIQEADKVLKKQPDLLCAKVLKGLALLRLGKCKDCEEILESVKKEVPCDDCTLQAMTICYREIHKLEKICDVYEKAVQKDPLNEELNTHLFMSYVRVGDYKKQQQVALNLYRIKPKNPYYFWSVMSILMQAQINDETVAQKVTLPLAERMVKKFIDEGKIEAEQEVQLYVMILEMQKKYKQALETIDSELGQKVTSYYMFSRKRIKLLENLEKWKDLNAYTKKMVLEEPDAYSYYGIYIDSMFKLLKSGETEDDPNTTGPYTFKDELIKPDSTIESCVSFIKNCQTDNQQAHKLRGPYLAILLLYRRLQEEGFDPVKYLGNAALDLFKNYFDSFSAKACCFKDLCQFLPLIQDDYQTLLSETMKIIEGTEDKSKKQMMMYLTHFQIKRYFSTYRKLSVNDKMAEISKLLDFYYDGHRFNTNLTSTDLGCNDTFMVLVAHLLHDLYLDTNDFKFIKDAICLLEYAYTFSPSNHHYKLLLLKFYNLLGASKAGYKYFQLLEIKHVQYDSLGYLECWPLLYNGQYNFAVHLLDNTLKFFNVNYKEAADQLTHAYKYGSFEKVNEFLNFREKLKNSFHYSLVTIEHLMHDITHLPSHHITVQTALHISINPEKSTVAELDHLVDNRDLQLFLNFDSESRRMNDEYAKLSFDNEVSLIRLRTMILRCIGASINVSLCASTATSSTPTNKNDEIMAKEDSYAKTNGVDEPHLRQLQIFMGVIEELRELYKNSLQKPPKDIPKDVFSGVESSKLFLYLKSPYFLPLLIDAMTLAYEFCNHCLTQSSTEKQVEKIAEISANMFSKLISECNQRITEELDSYNEIDQRELIEFLCLAVEIVCVLCIVCGNLHTILVPSKQKVTALTKRKKKKGGKDVTTNGAQNDEKNKEQIEEGILRIFTYYVSIVRDNIKTLEIHLSYLEGGWTELETHKAGFELKPANFIESNASGDADSPPLIGITEEKWSHLLVELNENLKDSYVMSIKQIREMVKRKIDYLSLLTF